MKKETFDLILTFYDVLLPNPFLDFLLFTTEQTFYITFTLTDFLLPGFEPGTLRLRGEHVNHYTSEVKLVYGVLKTLLYLMIHTAEFVCYIISFTCTK